MAQESVATGGGPALTRGNSSKPGEQESGISWSRGFRPLPDAEYRDRRLKGLCFTCDKKYSVEHVCKNKHFKLMVLEGNEEFEEPASLVEELREEEGQLFELDGRAMAGIATPKSLRVWGTLLGKRIKILIDSGAVDKFICQNRVKEL